MNQLFKISTASAWLLLWAGLAAQSANAQNRYPAIEDAWDGTDYRAVVQRVQKDGLSLPTIADPATKPVYDRMIDVDNIPLRMGLNTKLNVTIRFQKLDSALQPIHKLVVLYANEAKKGKPYGAELAGLMVYECKVSGALLDLSEPVLATLAKDARYPARVADFEQMKTGARQVYSALVQGMSETTLYAKPDILRMIGGARGGLQSYQPIFTDQDRQDLTQSLTKQIAATPDPELKAALTELRDAIEHRRIPT